MISRKKIILLSQLVDSLDEAVDSGASKEKILEFQQEIETEIKKCRI
ncbi:MAG: hypothetical protein ABH817_00700 [archaeon]